MNIQLNLLPDVKQQFIKTRRTRRLITIIALLTSSVAVAVTAMLFVTTNVWQARTINNVTEDIEDGLSELQAVPELSKILTVQEQLEGLDEVHNNKTAANRLYDYLPQILPQGVIVSELNVDFENQVVEIEGYVDNVQAASSATGSLEIVNKFVDTLKFTDYVVYEENPEFDPTAPELVEQFINQQDPLRAFSEVVLSGANKEEEETKFTVNAKFDPRIFETTIDNIRTNKVRLVVPQIITTRSETEQPGVLFDSPTEVINE